MVKLVLCYTQKLKEHGLAGNLIIEIDYMYINILVLVFLTIKGRPCLIKQGVVVHLFYRKLISASEKLWIMYFSACSEQILHYCL